MTFRSILFPGASGRGLERPAAMPDFFVDLNLDQIVDAVTAGKDEYDLKPFFYMSLRDADDVTFRHEVMQDLERSQLFGAIAVFAKAMRTVREHLVRVEKSYYKPEKERWFLDAVRLYCEAVVRLAEGLSRAEPKSRGLTAFGEYLAEYVASEGFVALRAQAENLLADLATVHYTILVKGLEVEVRHYDGEPDYSTEVEATFEKFQQGAVRDYAFAFGDVVELNHVEAMILDQVAKLYPGTFAELERFAAEHEDFLDSTIVRFDREIQFYVAYLEHLALFKKAGLSFCYPRVSRDRKEVYDDQGFDLALAGKLIGKQAVPVRNDFRLEDRERIIVVSGPNQGGKTTFARTFGQLHYLASLGCPVPGTRAQLFLFDRLFTHFEREEDSANLRGKLEDDLVRIHGILERATPDSIVIMNEIFTSTTYRDALALSRRIAGQIIALDMLGVWVTFLDELASLGPQTVSMVSTVVPDNPAERTYKIVRRPADGLAYALSIAEKYRLTYTKIKERIEP
jgi:DNA mismatch repair protein MutS